MERTISLIPQPDHNENNQLQAGDNFVRFSKYGGKVFGVVESIKSSIAIHEDCNIYKLKVRSTNGVDYDYSECYKSSASFDGNQLAERKKLTDKLKARRIKT